MLDRSPGASPLDVAFAAMSHPTVLAPRLLDRTADLDRYRERGVTNVPASRQMASLVRHGLPQREVDEALAAVDARDVDYGMSGPRGRARVSELSLRKRAQLTETAVHAARVALRDAVRSSA